MTPDRVRPAMTVSFYRRSSKVLATAVGAELVAFDPGAGAFFKLNAVAADIWDNLDRPRSFEELREQVLKEYEVPQSQCTRDLRQLLEDLEDMHLIEKLANPPVGILSADTLRKSLSAAVPTLNGAQPFTDRPWHKWVSPELRLCVTSIRSTYADDGFEQIRRLSGAVDWQSLLCLARYHRVQGFLWDSLGKLDDLVPPAVASSLEGDASEIATMNLRTCVEAGELLEEFTSHGLTLLFVKGLTLGGLAYPNPFLKMAWDTDLLVDPRQLGEAIGVLQARGFRLVLPASVDQLPAWHLREKESVWRRPHDGLFIELHTRLADNRALIPGIRADSPRQYVELAPGIMLPTLADDELFAYLAVHGASSAWFRLKWISDFAAFLHGRSSGEVEQLYQRSQDLGAGRAAGQALLLADALFDVLQPVPAIRDRLASDRAMQLLCRAALRMLTKEAGEPTEKPLGTLAIHWTQFLLQPGLAYKASELWRQAESVLKRGIG